ncbi:MAG: glutamate--tRNA ligase [Pseudomonadota bacterium]
MSVKARFAPSPTGLLHVGNIRTAVLNYLFCEQQGGSFMLRFDDTDTERAKEEFVSAIREDLGWLGLNCDSEVRQSTRADRYDAAAKILREAGLLYPCFETPDELERRRKRQLARGLPPIYDRAGLKLSPDEIAQFEGQGLKPHWRFRLPNTSADGGDTAEMSPMPSPVEWTDLVRGPMTVDLGSLSDPVMIREDGSYLYTFTSVVDDAEFEITHIIRGEDHVTNTGVQLALFAALGATPPVFGHHNLLIGEDGKALAKRLGSLSIASFREQGLEPMAVLSHAALIGSSDAIEPYTDIELLAAKFAPTKLSTAPARFDAAELHGLNAKMLHGLEYDAVAARLDALEVGGGADFWHAIRANISVVDEARAWWQVVAHELEPVIEDEEYARAALAALPLEPWTDATWGAWTTTLKEQTGRKGRKLFHPLRLALTGQNAGPEMQLLLPLIGHERAVRRLNGERG